MKGMSLFRAAELMTRTGSVVTLEIARQGAIYHGLATLLNQPSPMMQRGNNMFIYALKFSIGDCQRQHKIKSVLGLYIYCYDVEV